MPGWQLPYEEADLSAARAWLARLPMTVISQRHLAALWEQSADHAPVPVDSAWLDGGPTTMVKELRDASPGITVILDTDAYPDHDALLRYDARIRAVRAIARAENRKPRRDELEPQPGEQNRLEAVALPMPRHSKWREWRRYKGIPVAQAQYVDYDPIKGGKWNALRHQ